jgi:hypothetical protein
MEFRPARRLGSPIENDMTDDNDKARKLALQHLIASRGSP